MKAWLRALLSQAVISWWWALSAASTLSTFFFHTWSGSVRTVLAISSIVGFAWANYRVFQGQQSKISSLKGSSQSQEVRASDLRIVAQQGSRYILRPVQNIRRGDFRGMYLEFHLMIENQGLRKSTVNDFQVEIVELNRTFPRLAPQEGLTGMQGRHCAYGMSPHRGLSNTGLIRIDAESTTDRDTLIFYILDMDLRKFAECNLGMQGPEQRFPPLHCRLTITDTMNISATETFEMTEG